MAKKVALMESEYSKLGTALKDVHEDCIEKMEAVVKEIERLNTKKNGFHTKELSPKIDAIIKELNAVKCSMESVFKMNEKIIKSFQKVVDDYDTLK